MLEIIFLIWFSRKLASIARAKDRSGGWGALGVVLWVVGEVGGFVLAAMNGADGAELYGCGVGGAILAAIVAYVIVASLKPRPRDSDLPVARVI
jgi:hypothetical protein